MVYGECELLLRLSASERECKGNDGHRFGLLHFPRGPPLGQCFTVERVLRIIGSDILEKRLVLRAFSPDTREFIRCARDTTFESLRDEALGGISQ
jgi:hypothetical protein